MKKFLIFIFLAIGLSAYSQNVVQLHNGNAYALRSIDTLTNADTVTNTGIEKDHSVYYEVHILGASISGTILDTVYIEHAAYVKGSIVTPDFTTIATHPISTTGTTWAAIKTGNVGPGTIRIRTKSTGTQSTRLITTLQTWRKPT